MSYIAIFVEIYEAGHNDSKLPEMKMFFRILITFKGTKIYYNYNSYIQLIYTVKL